MRIIHTSDWHLGQSFYTKTRLAEHTAFIQWLLEQVVEYQVDAIIIAGDIFDTTSPPSYARTLYNDFIVKLQQYNCQLIILAGNHDSVAMLNESRQLLKQLNTHVIAKAQVHSEQQIITLTNQSGEAIALICAIPFLRAKDLVLSHADESISDKKNNLNLAITEHYQLVYTSALAQKGNKDIPIIATGHLTAMGVTKSDSVRDIYIGNLSGFDAAGFPAADYIALGHIHKAQKVAKQQHIRYCGSPIPLSFDELKSDKVVNLVEFEQAKLVQITPLVVPRFQQLSQLSGTVEEITQQLSTFAMNDYVTWLAIEIHGDDYLSDLQNVIAELVEPYPVEVLQLRRARNNRTQSLQQQQKETLSELTAQQVFEKRIAIEPEATSECDKARKDRITEQFQRVLSQVEGEQK